MSCSDTSWRELWSALDQRGDEIRVPRAALNEVSACDGELTGRVSAPLAVRSARGSGPYRVSRAELFAFLKYHGRECGR